MDAQDEPEKAVKTIDLPFFHKPEGSLAGAVFIIVLLFSASEITPGWAWFDLGWEKNVYFFIVSACGALAGLLGAKRRMLGLVACPLGGVCSLWTMSLVLSFLPAIPNIGLVIVMLIGFVPGFVVYWTFDKILQKHSDGEESTDISQGS